MCWFLKLFNKWFKFWKLTRSIKLLKISDFFIIWNIPRAFVIENLFKDNSNSMFTNILTTFDLCQCFMWRNKSFSNLHTSDPSFLTWKLTTVVAFTFLLTLKQNKFKLSKLHPKHGTQHTIIDARVIAMGFIFGS